MNHWISVNEHPPKENGRYLVTNGVTVEIGWYSTAHRLFYDGDGAIVFAVMRGITHWMLLPKPK